MKASARKSYGEYKAVIVHEMLGGRIRTEVLGQKAVPLIWRGSEYLPGGPTRHVRGRVFATRDEAVAHAQAVIDRRNEARKGWRVR